MEVVVEDKVDLKHISTDQLKELRELFKQEIKKRRVDKTLDWARRKKIILKPYDPDASLDQIRRDILHYNSSRCLAFPSTLLQSHPNDRLKYIKCLIGQDWSHLFSVGDTRKLYYVYAHCDPREKSILCPTELGGVTSGTPFYVGKGTGKRAWSMNRNQGHGLKIKDILRNGFSDFDIVHIFKDGLTEAEAFELESKLIYYFGTKYEENRNGTLLNLDIPDRPNFLDVMKKIPSRKQIHKKKVAKELDDSIISTEGATL